ncbi:MAG: hypothetical protein SFW67_16765 [Myxococcaceae bacterium]|nr:hypothetical protein [Myxococcaceae bacterium]
MSLHAAVLTFAGDDEAAAAVAEPQLPGPEAWSPMAWARGDAANDDVLLEAVPEPLPTFHSTDSGLAWQPLKVG